VFVFDSHRPLNLENTRADNRDVLVLRDEKEGEEHFPAPDSDYGESDDSSDDDSSDESDDDADENDDNSDDDDDKENSSGGNEGVEADEDDERAAKRRKKAEKAERRAQRNIPSPRTRRLRREQKRYERISYYSRGSFYGRAAGLLMYDIAHDTHKDSLEKHHPLWLAVVSLTDQYVHQRLSHESYTAGVMELATQVSNLPGADAPTSRVLDEGVVVRAFEDRRIQYAEEFRFSCSGTGPCTRR